MRQQTICALGLCVLLTFGLASCARQQAEGEARPFAQMTAAATRGVSIQPTAIVPTQEPAAVPLPETATLTSTVAAPEALSEPTTFAEPLPGLDAYLRDLAGAGQFMGSALVARGGQVLLDQGYGLADVNSNQPNTPQTKFRIGSLTKMFTAAAVLRLQEQGLLSVQDPASRFVPEYPGGEAITIHQLLTHTSGVPEYTERQDLAQVSQTAISLDDLIATFSGGQPMFQPGSQYHYVDSGYVLLTKILEVASGQPYETLIETQILNPAGMTSSGYDWLDAALAGTARGYRLTPGGAQAAPVTHPSWPSGAGGLYSTSQDLYRWSRALSGDTVLSVASREAMFSPWTVAQDGYSYGYGWHLGDTVGRPSQAHAGSIFGFNSYILRFPQEDAVIIVLSNGTQGPPRAVAEQLASILFSP